MTDEQRKIAAWMIDQLLHERDQHEDSAGVLQATLLAKAACEEHDAYEGGENYDIPEWVFELAAQSVDSAE